MNEQKLAKLVDSFYSFYPENHDRKCYLFFDEIQNVDNWPIVVRRLHDTKVDYVEDAYLAFNVTIYDKSIRKTHTNPKKLYAIDHGMVRALTLDFDYNLSK